MTDFVSDGQPFETPIGAATEGYAETPPTFGRGFAAMFHDNSALEPLTRFVNRSEYDTSGSLAGTIGRALAVAGETGGDALALPLSARAALPSMEAQPSPMLTADDANARYAPIGPDGKPAKITDAPIPEAVAQLVGQAKSDQIERDNVLQRFSDTRAWPVTFGSNMAAFMLDPLNAATALLPSIGEDAILGQLGRAGLTGFAARTVARGAAGAIGGAVAQAPLSALRYGLGTQEASDYSFRDALRDVMLSAAGGAITQAGFGALGDWLGWRRGAVAPEAEPMPSATATVAGADAITKADAMRAAVAQIADGREVDVEPVFGAAGPRGPSRPDDIVQFLAGSGGMIDQGGELRAIGADKEMVPFVGRLVKPDGATLDYAREAAEEAGYLQPGSTVSDLIEAVDRNMRGNPVFSDRDESDALAWRQHRDGMRRGPDEPYDAFDPNTMFTDLAEHQAQLYRDGYAPGIPQDEFDRERDGIYGAHGEAAETSQTDRDLAAAERELAIGGAPLHPEDEAELARTAVNFEAANAQAAAYQEAAGCLAGAAL